MPETPNVDACVSLAKKTLFANKRWSKIKDLVSKIICKARFCSTFV
jgi:hypothetical protein